jgi:hypothetical protein
MVTLTVMTKEKFTEMKTQKTPTQPAPVGYTGLIKNITSGAFITQGFYNPVASIIPVGGIGATVTKNITTNVTKGTATGLAKTIAVGGAGLLAGGLLFGGKQETTQTPTQTPVQLPQQATAQDLQQKARDLYNQMKGFSKAQSELNINPTVTPVYNVTAGGGVEIGGVTTTTETYNYTESGLSQGFLGQLSGLFAQPSQTATQTPTQATTSEQKTDNSMLLLIAGVVLAGILLLKKK